MNSVVYLMDCMKGMKQYPDGYFDLGVIDPPFGNSIMAKNKRQSHKTTDTTYRNKTIPPRRYFNELHRVCKYTIVFGCQYMMPYLKKEGSFVIWDKGADPKSHNMSACDVAWYSKKARIERVYLHWCGAVKCEKEPTIHIHQKPISLYSWIYATYLPQGGKVLDTHLGSGSSRIAADMAGNIDFTGFEIDQKHFYDQEERFKLYKSSQQLFKIPAVRQNVLF